MTKRPKILFLFVIAALSLVLAGYLLNPQGDPRELSILLWLTVCGTLCIYGFNIDAIKNPGTLVSNLFGSPFRIFFVLQLLLVVLPLSIMYIPVFRLELLGAICFLGCLYSIGFIHNRVIYRVKNTVLLKNILIGFGWGALVLVGAGTCDDEKVLALFLFTSLQILVGSTIRDIPDIENDKNSGMRTVPILFGVGKTLNVLHVGNILTFIPSFLISQSPGISILMLIVIVWKWLILMKVKSDKDSPLWTQTFNILTCSFIFILVLIPYAYEHCR